jgi:hypothetical protein
MKKYKIIANTEVFVPINNDEKKAINAKIKFFSME